jgi:hypothetical protein
MNAPRLSFHELQIFRFCVAGVNHYVAVTLSLAEHDSEATEPNKFFGGMESNR